MADFVKVDISGIKELRKAARKAGDKLAAKELGKAVKVSSEPVLSEAKKTAPRKSGKTARTPRARNVRRGRGAVELVAGRDDPRFPGLEPVHWGWASRNRTQPGKSGQPFLTNALGRHGREIIRGVGREVMRVAVEMDRRSRPGG